jgi:putative ATP-binding cassette transporter
MTGRGTRERIGPTPPAAVDAPGAGRALLRGAWARWLRAVRAVITSEIGGKVRWMFGAILLGLIGINGLNVLNSYVGRDLVTSIEQLDATRFLTMALAYVSVFAALTTVAVMVRFGEERLALLWRNWLTRRLVDQYLADRAYLHVREGGELANPDQRIADDAGAFAGSTLSFLLIFINAGFAIVGFSGVMWTISPLLFGVAVAYAGFGSLLTVLLGRRLVRLQYVQSDREAAFRTELVHVGENAESVALLRLEGRLGERLRRRIEALISNAQRIVSVNRNLGFFTTGFGYGIQLIPPLIVGPLFMRGKVEFGVVTQSAMAFAHLLGAFSLIVTQIQQLSSYAAVLARITRLSAAIERASKSARLPRVSTVGSPELVYQDLTLRSHVGEVLVAHLTLTISMGTRLLVIGTDEARRALFRATALGRDVAEGLVVRPGPEKILFLPERPHVPPGTVRDLLVSDGYEHRVSDESIHEVIRELGLGPALKRVGGLDIEGDWGHSLSLGEQQLFALARVLLATPAFSMIQNPNTTVAPEQLAQALRLFTQASITYVTFGAAPASPDLYDAVLELHADGSWNLSPLVSAA